MLTAFESGIGTHPDAIAVSFAGCRVTYAQLNERAEQIGCALWNIGVGSESLVAIFLDRSTDLIASLLGIWKAGGAYLPIDPINPRQRVGFTLNDSKVAYILTQRNLLNSLPPTEATVVCLEDIGPEQCLQQPLFAPAEVSPDQLAYVIYTSGSTGQPKGAEITHGALLNVIESIGNDVALKPTDVGLASATIAFDISNEEIFLPLLAGASVQMLEREFVGDGKKLIDVIRRNNVTLAFGTPTSWRLALEAGWRGDPNLQIIVGGEVLPLSLAKTLAGMTRALWNHYGPTETAICATRELVPADAEAVTLGWPVANTGIYVLDREKRPLAAGEFGEIYIRGAGVGRGYLNRPELTQKVFLADPFDSAPGARMYKTGDVGRLLPDGRLEFQGRVDNQIKLRGFRIELEEIEAAVRAYEGVHAAAVQLAEYAADDQRLVGYYLADRQVVESELRDFLRQRLPFYMLPSELIPLESLPTTLNGKIDREALNALRLKYEAQALEEGAQPPADDLEGKLLAIWQKLLKIRKIGPSDDFFDLGGHSLLATRMFAEIEKVTGRKIPLSVLIQNPTVWELAAYIRSRPEIGWPGLLPMREKGTLPPLFIAHGLGSHLLLFRGLTESLGKSQPVYGIQLTAPANPRLDELRLEAFAARTVEEICAVDPVGPYNLAGHSLGGLLVYEIAAQLRSLGKEVGLLALLDCDLHVARRPETARPSAHVGWKDRWVHFKKKVGRFFLNGMVNTIWRKFLYNKLMFYIWWLRRTHKEGSYHPQFFGVDPYIAIFAEKYRPEPLDVDTLLLVAEDELAPESAGAAWREIQGDRLEVRKIPGSHQTIFNPPNVSVLAGELAGRLDVSAKPWHSRPSYPRKNEPRQTMMQAMLEYHGG